jgi:mono/diheme cytochrome c family protein
LHVNAPENLLQPLDDAYLREIARHFAGLQVPYPAPAAAATASAETLKTGERLDREGLPSRRVPACAKCHGAALTGVAPGAPGLLGLPRDYLNAQLGAWRTGQRRAHAPDCMADVAKALSLEEVSAVSTWLAAQPVPASAPARPGARAPSASALAPGPAPRTAADAVPRCGSADATAAAAVPAALPTPKPDALVARGAYLARAGNCMGCHTALGGAPWAGGRAIETPFGAVYSSNLTPDKATGLGLWTAQDFWQALHHGRSRDGRRLVPAFPYTSTTLVSRADSDALHAYLMSLPAVSSPNKAHALRWPFGTQAALAVWRTLFFTPGGFEPQPGKSEAWNRGAYLVRGLGHCAACHAPRNALGATRSELDLAGGLIPLQNWYAPSLTRADEAGVAHWTQDEVMALLRDGVAPRGSVAGPMAEVVLGSTRHLDADDLAAMATYLRDLPGAQSTPAAGAPPAATSAAPVAATRLARGGKLYGEHCASCHGDAGQGVPRAYPPLAGNRAVTLSPRTADAAAGCGSSPCRPPRCASPRPASNTRSRCFFTVARAGAQDVADVAVGLALDHPVQHLGLARGELEGQAHGLDDGGVVTSRITISQSPSLAVLQRLLGAAEGQAARALAPPSGAAARSARRGGAGWRAQPGDHRLGAWLLSRRLPK